MTVKSRTFPLRTLLTVGLLVAGPAACKDSTGKDQSEAPALVQIVSGDDQEAVVGRELPNPVVVRVVDEEGDPIRGQLVNFRVTSGGGSVFSGSALTNANGEAQERWTLGTSTATPQRLEARAVDQESGAAIVFGTFEATARPGAAHRVETVAGAPIEGTAGLALGSPVAVAVFDQHGNPVPGVTVAWAATGGGTIAGASATTDATGRALAAWTLGTQVGAQTATATVTGLTPVTFSVAARAGAPASLEIVSGSGQSGTVATALGTPLSVRVEDAHGNVIVASTVEWAVVAGSATLGSPQSASGGDGTASNSLTLGTTAGEVRVRASVGAVTPAEFIITALAGAAHRVEIVDGGAQEGTVGQALPRPLTGVVRDQYGNPVAGITITWSTADGGSFSPSSSQSSVTGSVLTTWILGQSAGAQMVRATAAGLQEGSATATARPGSAAAISALSGAGQSGPIGSSLAAPLVAVVRDGFGNSVGGGTTVQWSVVAGAAILSSGESTTGADGTASISVVLGNATGEVHVRASLPSGQTADFVVTASVGAPAAISVVEGDGQTGRIVARLPGALVVRVVDQQGNPTPGVQVRWSDTVSGSSVQPTLTTTDGEGRATAMWTLGPRTGQQTATAQVEGTSIAPARFGAMATPATPAIVRIVSGDAQSGTVATALAQPLVVEVRDNFNNLVPGAAVAWTIVAGSGLLESESTTANASGQASTVLMLGTAAGPVRVRASNPTAFAPEFTATAMAGPFAQLLAVSSLSQDVSFSTTLAAPPVVRAADQYGNNVGAGIPVSWAVLSGSGTVSATPTITDTAGRAQTFWALGPEPVQTVRASAGPIDSPVFTTRVLGAGSATLEIVSGSGVTETIGTVLRQPMVVRMLDAGGQPVLGARIQWTVVSGSAVVGSPPPTQSSVGAQSSTGPDGLAQMFARMGTIAGEVRIRASASGGITGVQPVEFVITAVPGPYPYQVVIVGGRNQPFIAGEPLGQPVVAEVRDQNGSPLPGVVVTWDNAYGSVNPGQSTTGSNGRASTVWTLGSVAGPQYIRAVVWGGPWVNFDIVAVPGPAAAIKVFHSDSGSGVVGTTGSTAVVRVVDAHDNGVTGQTVNWSILSGSATLASPTTQSGQGGATINNLTYGPQSGQIRIRASIGSGAFVDLTETALPGATNRIVVVQGSGQTGPAGQPLPVSLIVEVQDQFGNPKPGISVTWEPASASSGNVVKAPGGTDANGRSHAVWTLGTQAGTQTVTARVSSGAVAPATFTATATPGP